MRTGTSRLLVAGAAAFLAAGHPVKVWAQSTLLCPGGTTLINGQCSDNAFSGAAQASQALSELSETSTGQSSQNTMQKIGERREAERDRCAEGFTRVNGECEPVKRPEREEKKAAEAKPAPETGRKVKKAEKAKGKAIRPAEEGAPAPKATKAARREKPQPGLEAAAPPPGMVCKDGPCAPIPIEPGARFGAWAQVNGDYEHRNAGAPQYVAAGSGAEFPGAPIPVQTSVTSRSGTVGFQAGGDFTTRGIWAPNDGLIAGAMTGFAYSDLMLNTSAISSNFNLVHNLSGQMHATLTGGMVGLYATYFDGPFSADILAKADVFSLSENFTDSLAFSIGSPFAPGSPACATTVAPAFSGGPFDCRFGNVHDPLPVINTTVMANFNYRFILNPDYWVEPTVGIQFTATTYPNISKPNPVTGPVPFETINAGTTSAAARLGLADGDLLMVQGGARVGATRLLDSGILMTTTLTGLAYDDVLVTGGFVPTLAFAGSNLLAHSDEGQVRGRGILAFNFNLGQGLSTYVQGDVYGGRDLFGAGGKAGIRYQW